MCNNPVFWKDHKGHIKERPCQNCIGCRIDKLLLWENRCSSEFVKYRSTFLTLTYDDNHVPFPSPGSLYYTLRREHAHKYIDNLRHQVVKFPLPKGNVSNFTYFLNGEYGDRRARPHLHALVFGLDFKDCKTLFQRYWKNGHIISLPILPGGIRYVVDYMTKQVTGPQAVELYDTKNIEHPFTTSSKGLGSEFIYAHKEEIADTGYIKIGSRKVTVPQYYVNNCRNFSEEEIENLDLIKFSNIKKNIQIAKANGFNSYQDYISYQRVNLEKRNVSAFRSHGKPVMDFDNLPSVTRDLIYNALVD